MTTGYMGAGGQWKSISDTPADRGALTGAEGKAVSARMAGEVWITTADNTGATSAVTAINAALTSAALLFPLGFCAYPQRGAYLIDDSILLPDYCTIDGISRDWCKFVVSASIPTTSAVIRNKSTNAVDGSLISPLIRIKNITFDGTARSFPAWLTTSGGVAIADPRADYRAGGCLAPTSIAVAGAVTVSGGKVTGIAFSTGGSGYVYPPTVWITGDGVGAIATATTSAGAVTGYTVVEGGFGYTAATAEIAGGGANPLTALYAANRRNPNYALNIGCIELTKCDRPVIEGCRFIAYGGTSIIDMGSDQLVVERCEFVNCGQTDYVGNCLWSQSHGNPAAPPVFYRQSTNTEFRFNTIIGQKRSVALLGGSLQKAHHNTVKGWRESCFFISDSAVCPEIYENTAQDGLISDIVCTFVEGGQATGVDVHNNRVTNLQGQLATIAGHGGKVVDNKLRVTSTTNYGTIPFGPYSERVGFGSGNAAIAGTQSNVRLESCAVLVQDIDADANNAPKSALIRGNHIYDPNGYLRWMVQFSKGASKSIGPVYIEGNDITEAPSIQMFEAAQADACLNPNKPFRVVNNPGHVSMGAKLIATTIPSGSSGTIKYTFGFRPKQLVVMARTQQGASVVSYHGVFVDDESLNPGAAGATNTSGAAIRLHDNGTARGSETQNLGGVKVLDAAGTTVFNTSAIGFSSDGWSMQVNVSTATIDISLIAIP